MKTHSFYLLVACAAGMLAVAAPISGQNAAVRPVAVTEVPLPVQSLIDQIAEQNKQLTASQAAMEAQIDDLAETIRVSRILAARAGGKGKQ